MSTKNLNRRLRTVAHGAVAGLVGTVTLSLFERLEKRLLGRSSLYAPERIVSRLAVERGIAISPHHTRQLAWGLRFVYGTAIGITMTCLDARPGPRLRRVVRRAGTIWGLELTTLPLVGAVPPLLAWPVTEVLLLAAHTTSFALGAELGRGRASL